MTRLQLREHVHSLALLIGLRPAARKCGVNEDTACAWSSRYKWNLPPALNSIFGARPTPHALKADASVVREGIEQTFREQSEDSRLYLSSAVLKASHEFASIDPKELTDHRKSQALLNVSRTGDTVHGWQAMRMQGVTVQVANLVMPSADERAALNQVDRRLDDISRRLQERSTSSRNTASEK